MKFATAHTVPKPSHISVTIVSLCLAIFFVAVVLLQLFTFEEYPAIIDRYRLPIIGTSGMGLSVAALIVSLEVLAIPYLLWMKLSRAMRFVSLVSGVVALVYWLKIGLWQVLGGVDIPNAGLLGSKVLIPQGWWLVGCIVVLLVGMGYIIYSQRRQLLRLTNDKK